MDLREITIGRVMAALAVLTVLAWAWAIADSGIPRGIFFLFGVIAPVALFILFLSTVVANMGPGDTAAQPATAPSVADREEDEAPRDA